MSDHLANLVDQQRIVAIDAAPIPLSTNVAVPGDYLFVNCHYHASLAVLPRTELLELARVDALEICRRLATDQRMNNCVASIVTIYGHFPVPNGTRPARRRIYRVTVLSPEIRSNRVMSPSFLSDVHAEESSELDDVAELLHDTAP
jgi:hypothetical protein